MTARWPVDAQSRPRRQRRAQIITAQPDVRAFELTSDDRFFVLACDGIWDVLSNQEAVDLVASLLEKGLSLQVRPARSREIRPDCLRVSFISRF